MAKLTRIWAVEFAVLVVVFGGIGGPALRADDRLVDLFKAIHMRDDKRAIEVIRAGVELNTVGTNGEIVLGEAIAEGLPKVAIAAVGAGVDVNLSDAKGVSPLMYASWYCDYDIAKLLLARHAKVNVKDLEGYTALMYATSNCRGAQIVTLLLSNRAAINAQSESGDTALTLAADAGNERAVRALIDVGANPEIRNVDGHTALQISKLKEIGRTTADNRVCALLSAYEHRLNVQKQRPMEQH